MTSRDPDAADQAFLEIRALPAALRPAAVARLTDPEVRAEVASLLEYDDPTPFIRAPGDPTADAIRPPILGTVLAERYEVQLLAAEGGFGWVYRGYDLASDAPVAIKLFKPSLHADADAEARVAREQRVLAALAEEAAPIVACRASGSWQAPDGARLPFLVMDWLDGPTLRTWLRQSAPDGMPFADAVRRLDPIADALAAAHARGIAHRDLKPSNVMCQGDAADPALMLVDFGTAKLAADRAGGFDSTTTRVGAITIEYAAPEQFDKRLGASGPRSDVHALALLLVELSAGRNPWGSLDLLRQVSAIGDPKARPTPRARGVEVSTAVEAVMRDALAVDPQRRPADAGAFWAALNTALERAPVPRWRRLFTRRG